MNSQITEWSPPVTISYLQVQRGQIAVVRDDLLSGGTKQRAAIPFLESKKQEGVREFIYASPFSGYAQIALAVSCEAVGVACKLFVERRGGMSSFTALAAKYADVLLFDSLEEAEESAKRYADSNSCLKLPLGFDDPTYKSYLKSELEIQWDQLCVVLGYVPKRLWLPVGSGTLATLFRDIVPYSTRLECVDVQVLPRYDARIVSIREMPNVGYHKTLELFCERVKVAPPVPSNCYYDAKLWNIIFHQGSESDVWWNVAA